jgi:sulfide:quinone oxidoreductase
LYPVAIDARSSNEWASGSREADSAGSSNHARVKGRDAVKVVIAGGGFAGLETMLALRALAGRRVAVELLAPEPEFLYRPLAVAQPFGLSRTYRFPLAALAERSDARYRRRALAAVDAPAGRVATAEGDSLSYDALVVACGALTSEAVPGALAFRGLQDVERFREIVEQIESGAVRRVAFVLPAGVSWPLPLYELALLTASQVRPAAAARPEITLVTPERAPLAVFGTSASNRVRALLAEREIRLATEHHAVRYANGTLDLVGGEGIEVDAVVALPLLRGPRLSGLPHDHDGFLEVDDHCRVRDVPGVYAVGDVTASPVKQGGLATQQADVTAETIAAEAGLPVQAMPLDPVLRALLLTGDRPVYLRAALGGHHGDPGVVDWEPLWWPPAKVAGLYLAPFLAENLDLANGEPP